MIDLLDIMIDIPHEQFGAERIVKRKDNSRKTKRYSETIYINLVRVFVTSLKNGSSINMRCSPLKALQGHNIFGTNDVGKIAYEIIVKVLKQLNIEASKDQLLEWGNGEFRINEIHLTHRFPVKEPQIIKQVVSHIHRYTSMSLAPSVIGKGVGVTLKAPLGLAEWMFYDKCREFNDKRLKEHKYLEAHADDDAKQARRLLNKTASKSIRTELKLNKGYLTMCGLDRGKCWTPKKIRELYLQELSLLHLGEIPALPQLPEVYKQIEDSKLRSVVILWANGEDLSDYYGRTTHQKYRRAIRDKLGIDIQKDHPLLKAANIELADIFDPANMLTGFPKWVSKYPALAFR